MLFIRLAIISFIYPLICGFTLDYEILSACESKHPNDLIARTVCNNNLEREKNIRTCATEESKSIDKKIEDLIDLLEIYHPIKLEKLVEIIKKNTKFNPSLQPLNQDTDRNVIVFRVPTKCDVGFELAVAIYENKKDDFAYAMTVWRDDDPKAKNSNAYRVHEYAWHYKSNLELKEKYLNSFGYLSEAEYRSKLQNLEIRKIKKIAELFSKELEFEAKNFQSNSQILLNKFIDLVNRKSLIFKAQPYDALKQTVTINSDIFPNLKYVLSLKIELMQISLSLSSDKSLEPIFTRRIDIPQATNVEVSASNVNDNASISNYLMTLCIILIGALFIFKENISNYFFTKKTTHIDAEFPNSLREKDTLKDSYFGYSEIAKSNPSAISVKPKINHKEFLSEKAFEEFRAKHPFVMVDVDPSLRMQFIEECTWLEKKIGHFPSEKEQLEILNSLTSKK